MMCDYACREHRGADCPPRQRLRTHHASYCRSYFAHPWPGRVRAHAYRRRRSDHRVPGRDHHRTRGAAPARAVDAEDGHTFFFNLEDGPLIDRAQGGNSARWINHSCAPNCEAEQEGDRIFIRATRKIEAGREVFIDYQLDVEGRRTAALKRMYACRCAARRCRGTMLEARR